GVLPVLPVAPAARAAGGAQGRRRVREAGRPEGPGDRANGRAVDRALDHRRVHRAGQHPLLRAQEDGMTPQHWWSFLDKDTWNLISAVLQIAGTLAIFTFLWKDNPVYKMAEHIFVGV